MLTTVDHKFSKSIPPSLNSATKACRSDHDKLASSEAHRIGDPLGWRLAFLLGERKHPLDLIGTCAFTHEQEKFIGVGHGAISKSVNPRHSLISATFHDWRYDSGSSIPSICSKWFIINYKSDLWHLTHDRVPHPRKPVSPFKYSILRQTFNSTAL